MITQEWTKNESEYLENLGFSLNFRNYYVKENITLTKRLDPEFNELYYQAYNDDKTILSNILANRVENAFSEFVSSINDILTTDLINFDKLLNFLKENKIECSFKKVEDGYDVVFNKQVYKSSDVEKTVLYLTLNYIINDTKF